MRTRSKEFNGRKKRLREVSDGGGVNKRRTRRVGEERRGREKENGVEES